MNRSSGTARNWVRHTGFQTILRVAGVDTLVLVGIATDVAVEFTARAASDLAIPSIVVSDACQADSDEAHARALNVLQKWFSETPTADEVLSGLESAIRCPRTWRKNGADRPAVRNPTARSGLGSTPAAGQPSTASSRVPPPWARPPRALATVA